MRRASPVDLPINEFMSCESPFRSGWRGSRGHSSPLLRWAWVAFRRYPGFGPAAGPYRPSCAGGTVDPALRVRPSSFDKLRMKGEQAQDEPDRLGVNRVRGRGFRPVAAGWGGGGASRAHCAALACGLGRWDARFAKGAGVEVT